MNRKTGVVFGLLCGLLLAVYLVASCSYAVPRIYQVNTMPLTTVPELAGSGFYIGSDDYNIDNMFQTRRGFQRGYYVVKALYDYKTKAATGAMGWLYSKYPHHLNKDSSFGMWRELDWEYVPMTDTTQPFNTQRYPLGIVNNYYLPNDFDPAHPPPALTPQPLWNTENITHLNYAGHLQPHGYADTVADFFRWCNEVAAPVGDDVTNPDRVPNIQPPAWLATPGGNPPSTPPGYPEVIAMDNLTRRSGNFISYGSHSIPAAGTFGQNGNYQIYTSSYDTTGKVTDNISQYVWLPDTTPNAIPVNQRHTTWNEGTSGLNVALTHFFLDSTSAYDATNWNYYVIAILDDGIKFYITDNWTGPASLAGVAPIGQLSDTGPCTAPILFDTPFAQEYWKIAGLDQQTSAMQFMFQLWMDDKPDPGQTSWSGHNPDFDTAEAYVSYIAHYDQAGNKDYEVDTNNWDVNLWPNQFSQEFFINTYHPYNVSFTNKNGDNALCLRLYKKSEIYNYIDQARTDGIVFIEFAITPTDDNNRWLQYKAFDQLRFEVFNPGQTIKAYEFLMYPYDIVDQGILAFKQGTTLKVYVTRPGQAQEYFLGTIAIGWPFPGYTGASIVEDLQPPLMSALFSDGTKCTHINIMLQNLNTAANTASIPSATGSGTVTFSVSAGQISGLTAHAEDALTCPGKPVGLSFPHGFFSCDIINIPVGGSVLLTQIYPSQIPMGTLYWFCKPNAAWYSVPIISDDGDETITLLLTDGGVGDADGIANGVIEDPGGPGITTSMVSTSSSAAPSLATDKLIQEPVQLPLLVVENALLSDTAAVPGQPVDVIALVRNRSTVNGSLRINLYINGQLESAEGVTVQSGTIVPVHFTIHRNQPGTYNVRVNNLDAGSFVVDWLGNRGQQVIFGTSAFLVLLSFVLFFIWLLRRRQSNY